MEKFKESLIFSLNQFYFVDFLLLGLFIFLFLFLLIFVFLFKRRFFLALFLLIFDFVICIFGFFYVYNFIDLKIRAREIELLEQKILPSSRTLVLDYELKNLSKNDFKICKISARIYQKTTENDNFLNKFKKENFALLKNEKEILNLYSTQSQIQRMSFKNFEFDEFEIKFKASCF